MREGLPVSAIIVAQKIGWRRIPRKCFHDLLGQPLRRRIPGHRKPQQLSPSMSQDDKSKQALKRQSWNNAEIDCRNHIRMVAQEGSPILGMAVLAVGSCTWRRLILASSNPSLSNSPWMRGAPHNGFSLLIRRIRSRSSRSIFSASLADLGISSANRPEILRDAIAGWYRVEQVEPNRAGLARAWCHPHQQDPVTPPQPETSWCSPQGEC